MSLRIAFDLDGTLADLDSALADIAHRLFPPAAPPAAGVTDASERPADPAETAAEEQAATPAVRALDRRQQHAIWAEVKRTENFWESLGETEPGIVARINELAQEHRWEVLFITQRPESGGDTTQRQSQRWLARQGFELPSVYVLAPGASRGKAAAALALDAVVDDRTENCLDVKVDSGARAFLVTPNAPPNVVANAKRLGLEVVPSVAACLDLLTASSPKKGLLHRLKQGLGL